MSELTKNFVLTATIEGYASLFNTPDQAGDIIKPDTFLNKKDKNFIHPPLNRLKMLYQHKIDCPVGRWVNMCKDERGLFVKGELLLNSPKAAELYELLRGGAIDGLSVGFRTLVSKKARMKQRIIEKAELWEISIVSFPMAQEARITHIGEPVLSSLQDPVRAGLSTQTARRASFSPSGARQFAETLRGAASILSRV